VHKVTIIPRGHALGVTHFLPVDERHNYGKQYWLNELTSALGGRAAEKLALDDITTGAAQDLAYATMIARRMVCEWGMSEALGPVTFGKEDRQVFLGREIGRVKDHSEATAVLIDKEIRALVDEACDRAEKLLSDNLDKLHLLAKTLLERETLTGNDLDELFGVSKGDGGGQNGDDEPKGGKSPEAAVESLEGGGGPDADGEDPDGDESPDAGGEDPDAGGPPRASSSPEDAKPPTE
jgi:cell division protease FtsH